MGKVSYHFSEKSAWINDPNGLIYHKGQYHMFYQNHPHSTKWGSMHWGHAKSKDLVHWEFLPIALYPDELGAIFSGSAVLDKHNVSGLFRDEGGLVAIFTHAGEDNQKQSIAYSLDNGVTWVKYRGNPVLSNPGIKDFRDPKVFWHKESNKWVMVLACGGEIRFYCSNNLIQWNYLSTFGEKEGAPGGILECPTLLEFKVKNEEERKWILKFDVIGTNEETPYRALYYIGSFDGQGFICENKTSSGLLVDGGSDFYAAQDWYTDWEEEGRVLWIAWMNNWKYAEATPTAPWRGTMTIPRELELIRDKDMLVLSQRPIKELETLRAEKYMFTNTIVNGSDENILSNITGSNLEIKCNLKDIQADRFGFKVRTGQGEETIIGFDKRDKVLYVDRTKCGNTGFHENFAKVSKCGISSRDNDFDIHIFVDEFSVEIFASNGTSVITELIFPSEGSDGLEFFVEGGSVNIKDLTVFKLKV